MGRLILVGWLVAVVPAAAADEAAIVVEGQREEGRWFVWTVINRSAEPITYFKAPHDYGYTVNPPEGWDYDLTGRKKHGFIECESKEAVRALRRGNSMEFRIELHGEYQPAPQSVTVGFADGARIELSGVLCPMKEPFLRNHFPAIGLGAIFAVFLIAQAIRSRKQSAAAGAEGGQ